MSSRSEFVPASSCGGSPSPPLSPSALMTSCAASSVGDQGRVLRGAAGSAIVLSLCLRAGDGVREPQLEETDPRRFPPGVHGRLATPVMDLQTLGDVQGMSVAPRWDVSGTTAIKWFLDCRVWERDWMYWLIDAMRRAVLPSPIPASRSHPLKEMVNRYPFRYQDLLRELTEEVLTEAKDDVILEAFHTVQLSSLTPTPRKFINFVEQFLAWGRRVCNRITQRQAKDRLLDVFATMKVHALLKEIIKDETKVGLEFIYLRIIVFVMNPLMSRHKYASKKGHVMRRLGYAIHEAPATQANSASSMDREQVWILAGYGAWKE